MSPRRHDHRGRFAPETATPQLAESMRAAALRLSDQPSTDTPDDAVVAVESPDGAEDDDLVTAVDLRALRAGAIARLRAGVEPCDTAYCTRAAEPGCTLCATCMTRLEAALEAGVDCLAAQEEGVA